MAMPEEPQEETLVQSITGFDIKKEGEREIPNVPCWFEVSDQSQLKTPAKTNWLIKHTSSNLTASLPKQQQKTENRN